MAETTTDVYAQVADDAVLVGRLFMHRRRGMESATFTYADSWLARSDAYAIDPALPMASGAFHTAAGHALFGALTDAAPDRWGQRLLERNERRRADRDGMTGRTLGAADYLLGVRDDVRHGALRFRDVDSGEYLAPASVGVPPLVELGRLLAATDRLERDEALDADVELLLHAGGSLGGARPKAHVLEAGGLLSIAKFPRIELDEWNVVAWEQVAYELARSAGIEVPASRLERVAGRDVLVVARFDRIGGQRIGYCSAMTMLEAADGDRRSYLDIADVIEQHSVRATADLHELWRRIAFSILISNTDDHLRNHGFLRDGAGWSLSPAFDLNPTPGPGDRYLSTAIDFDSTAASIDTLIDVAPSFRLDDAAASSCLARILQATQRWREVATRLGIRAAELSHMRGAFEHAQADRAMSIAR